MPKDHEKNSLLASLKNETYVSQSKIRELLRNSIISDDYLNIYLNWCACFSGAYDLHRVYLAPVQPPLSAADVWLPIDVSLQLSFQKALNRIPATFEPKGTNQHGSRSHVLTNMFLGHRYWPTCF